MRIISGRRIAGLFLTLLMVSGLTSLAAGTPKVAATNSWTAAYCRAAGIEDVRILAPVNLQHPPDYELRPSDIPALMDADIIVFAGYEGMMDRIRSSIAGTETELLQISTGYSPAVIAESVNLIAAAAGTEDRAAENLTLIDEAWETAETRIQEAGLNWKKAAVHFHQGPFAWTVGLFEVASFGPPPPGPKLITEIAESGAELILDNWHNPIAAPLTEVLPEAVVVTLINFPGPYGTEDLADVILMNAEILVSAAAE